MGKWRQVKSYTVRPLVACTRYLGIAKLICKLCRVPASASGSGSKPLEFKLASLLRAFLEDPATFEKATFEARPDELRRAGHSRASAATASAARASAARASGASSVWQSGSILRLVRSKRLVITGPATQQQKIKKNKQRAAV